MQVIHPIPSERRRFLSAARRIPPSYSISGRKLPPVFLFTDGERTPDPGTLISAMPRGWGVVYRHFGEEDRLSKAHVLVTAARKRQVIVLVSADPELAEASHADGVHWPEHRLPDRLTRRPHWIVSASAHSSRAMSQAAQKGADLVFVSKVFESRSRSKSNALGLFRFAATCARAQLPVFALGGINSSNIERVLGINPENTRGIAAVEGLLRVLSKAQPTDDLSRQEATLDG